jgi:hypothetical protein
MFHRADASKGVADLRTKVRALPPEALESAPGPGPLPGPGAPPAGEALIWPRSCAHVAARGAARSAQTAGDWPAAAIQLFGTSDAQTIAGVPVQADHVGRLVRPPAALTGKPSGRASRQVVCHSLASFTARPGRAVPLAWPAVPKPARGNICRQSAARSGFIADPHHLTGRVSASICTAPGRPAVESSRHGRPMPDLR